MRKQDLQNDRIDIIGKRLIGSSMLNESEIDRIVDSPTLYSTVRDRVNAAPAARPRFVWFRIPAVAAFASLLVIIGVSAFVVLRQDDSTQTALKTAAPVEVNKSSEPDGFTDKFQEPGVIETEAPTQRDEPQIQNASYRKPVTRQQRKPLVVRPPDLEFIPLVYTGDPAEAVRGGRIIRVELSRASLFAMGFNVPIENGAETVKADLLVGQDGVPRGIRMANN